MSTTAETMAGRALPLPDNTSRYYWSAAARGELVIQRCRACGQYQFYPRPLCISCAGEPEWVPATGRGTVYTYTIVRQNRTPPFAGLVPYAVAIIELEEGVRMMSNVIDCPVKDLYIGMAVEVVLVPVEDGIGLPFWRPAEAPK